MASCNSSQIACHRWYICSTRVASKRCCRPGMPSSSCRLHGGQKSGRTLGVSCFHLRRHNGLMQTWYFGTNSPGSKHRRHMSQTSLPSMKQRLGEAEGSASSTSRGDEGMAASHIPHVVPCNGTIRATVSTSTTMQREAFTLAPVPIFSSAPDCKLLSGGLAFKARAPGVEHRAAPWAAGELTTGAPASLPRDSPSLADSRNGAAVSTGLLVTAATDAGGGRAHSSGLRCASASPEAAGDPASEGAAVHTGLD
mmetsp:Transcript_88794/g.287524  ORF Transcript_88794/g.287524 Transcript_88794/m.287524 type:complete len:253 (-) Transcript_88794:335-1093(-)